MTVRCLVWMSAPRMVRFVIAIALACGLSLWAGCAERERSSDEQPAGRARGDKCAPCRCGSSEHTLSEPLMSRLATARAYHHQADLHLRRGELDRAVAAVEKILELDLDRRWPEAEEARLDAVARLAKLLEKKKELARALQLVDSELKKKARPSFYLANLHSVRGELLEARVAKLEAADEKKRARELAREAIAAFEQSIRINKQLQQRLDHSGRSPKGRSGQPGPQPTESPEPAGEGAR